MSYRLAIFDLDGTLLNTLEDLTAAMNHVLALHRMPLRTIDEVRRFVGNGIPKLIERAVPEGTDKETQQAMFTLFMAWYTPHCRDKTRPYDGIPELLSALRNANVKTSVVSNKADSAVRKLADEMFPGLFDCAVGSKEGVRNKPAPDSVLEVLRTLDIAPSDTVYIGDSDVDIDTARNASLPCISVSWGFRDVTFLKAHGASVIADTPDQVRRMILED